jgi:catechol 2,3-dioxygenase-like lactoylglutathione lyase family enzyme
MAGFVAQVEEINALARRAPGFVAQPAPPDEGAVFKAPFLLNVSVWESLEALDAFTHQGRHAEALARRGEWFVQGGEGPTYVLYWAPRGHAVTEREVKERLDHLGEHGPTPYAFTFERPFPPLQALVDRPAGAGWQVERLDHLVLTVRDIQATCAFYTAALGMRVVTFGQGRTVLAFGTQKINLHQAGREFEPKAAAPTPGSADLCFLTAEPVEAVAHHLRSCGVAVLEGPVERTGATGPIRSVYCRDPDGNLIEVANLVG